MWEKQISISFIQILAWISMRFSRKLHYYCEERSMLMLCHCIYLQSLLHSAWRNNSPQIMTFCSHSSFAHILRSPCSCSTRDQKQKTSRPEEGKECLLTGLVCTHSSHAPDHLIVPPFVTSIKPRKNPPEKHFGSTTSCWQVLDPSKACREPSSTKPEQTRLQNMRSVQRFSSGRQKNLLVWCQWIEDAKLGAGSRMSLCSLGQRKPCTSALLERGHETWKMRRKQRGIPEHWVGEQRKHCLVHVWHAPDWHFTLKNAPSR